MQVARKADSQTFWIPSCVALPFEAGHTNNICKCLQNFWLSNDILGLQLVKCCYWGISSVYFTFAYLDFFCFVLFCIFCKSEYMMHLEI